MLNLNALINVLMDYPISDNINGYSDEIAL